MNWKTVKKKILPIPWWSFPFVIFGIYDVTNNGFGYTNTMIIFIPGGLGIFFFILKIKNSEPKKSLKRERI